MPATQGYRLAEWHEPPFLTANHSLEPQMNMKAYDPNSIDDVAECLLETDDQIDSYRWVLSDDEVRQLALESAQMIIQKRQERYADNLAEMQFRKAKANKSAHPDGSRLAVVVSLAQNLSTGETTVIESSLPMGRVFG